MSEKSTRFAELAGSVINVFQAGDYSDYMPRGSALQSVGCYFSEAGMYLTNATKSQGKLVHVDNAVVKRK
jgi:hypothetical protein